jgi:hypothetical protein
MAFFRAAIFLLLLGAGVCFAVYAGTGDARYKRYGLAVLKWTIIAAFAFFAILIVDRLA